EAWTKPANLGTQWRSVWGDATDDVYVVGLSGKIAHWDGKTWSYLTASTEGEDLFSVWGSGPHDIYAAGSQRIFHSNGQTWSAVFSAPSPISWSSVWGSAPNDVYAVGDAGTIVHWDGERWGTMSSGTTERLISVAGSGPGDVFAGSQHRLLHLRAGVWEPVMLPDPVSVGPGDDVGDRWSGGIWVAPTRVFVVGGSSETHLDRGSVTCQGPERICDDGWDNDCDGLQDGADPDCAGKAANERCANLADDDYDGLTDCADPDCATFPRCRQQ
ncbi:MAG TPA: hypothetical protein VFK05_36270, partial [Polyangiaceae bacterium]|nr:hypothetical protein [Polyangiaceae bacterium]